MSTSSARSEIAKIGLPLMTSGTRVLTHCNAGWLALVDWGSAPAPIYLAHRRGRKVFVWVDETRPRNQGANLTSWEFLQEGVPHKIIADNAGGFYMRRGEVDLCIVGRRPHRGQRRRGQQDRHVSEGRAGARERHSVLRGRAEFDDRFDVPQRR